MIINIRGTSGSGKSTIVRELMARCTVTTLGNPPEAYKLISPELRRPVYAIGKYTQACGGCDTIKTQDEVCYRVSHYSNCGHVVFEGLLISHLFSRYAGLDRTLRKTYVWAFLDTPLEVCLERVRQRRIERGVKAEFNTKNTVQKWHDARRVFEKGQHAGLDVRWVNYQTATQDIWTWLVASETEDAAAVLTRQPMLE